MPDEPIEKDTQADKEAAAKRAPIDPARRAAAVQRARALNRERNVRRDKLGVGGMIFTGIIGFVLILFLLWMLLILLPKP